MWLPIWVLQYVVFLRVASNEDILCARFEAKTSHGLDGRVNSDVITSIRYNFTLASTIARPFLGSKSITWNRRYKANVLWSLFVRLRVDTGVWSNKMNNKQTTKIHRLSGLQASSFSLRKSVGEIAKQASVGAWRASVNAASRLLEVTRPQSSTQAHLFCVFPKDFWGKEKLLTVYRNSSQITGKLLTTVKTTLAIKMCIWINLLLVFFSKIREQ